MILIVWGLGPGVKTKRIREICTGYSIGWNVAYTSHTDIYSGVYILNLSLLANSIEYTHLSWTWKPSTMTITITMGNHELATALWSLLQALCYIMLWCFIWASRQVQSNTVFCLDTSLLLLTTLHCIYFRAILHPLMILIWTTSIHGDRWSFTAFLGQLSCLHFRTFLWQCCHVDDGTMWIFHLGSQFLLDGICRPSWSKHLVYIELIVDTGQSHIFQAGIQVG